MENRDEIEELVQSDYRYGFSSDIESETIAPGLNEDVVRFISAKKNEPAWLLEFRLEALKRWRALPEPDWARLEIPPFDYDAISYWSAPKSMADRPQSLSCRP
jgi:ABC-type transport system involved in Fe-S cluster assembly, permease component